MASGIIRARAVVLLVACGLAFVPFLPRELRRPSLAVPVVPVVALAIAPLALVTTATLGIPLTATSIRVVVLLLTLAPLRLPRFQYSRNQLQGAGIPWRGELPTLVLLAAILALGALSTTESPETPPYQARTGPLPLLRRSDRRAERHSIDNPFFMGGGSSFARPRCAFALRRLRLVGDSRPVFSCTTSCSPR